MNSRDGLEAVTAVSHSGRDARQALADIVRPARRPLTGIRRAPTVHWPYIVCGRVPHLSARIRPRYTLDKPGALGVAPA